MPKNELRKCSTASGRHRWQFLRNAVRLAIGGDYASMTSYGIYQCQVCRVKKTGQYQQQFGVEK